MKCVINGVLAEPPFLYENVITYVSWITMPPLVGSKIYGAKSATVRSRLIDGICCMTLVEQYRTQAGHLRANANNPKSASGDPISQWVILGWIISLVGPVLWLYGHFEFGHPSLINWYWIEPYWIAPFFRNVECETGTAFSLAGIMLIWWPHLRGT